MKQVAQKKKDAQDHYYGQGTSPMVKQNNFKQQKQQNFRPNQNQQQQNKRTNSVQQRLGVHNTANNNTNKVNRKQFIPQTKQAKLNRIQGYNNKKVQNKGNVQNRNINNQRRKYQNKNTSNKTIRAVNPRTGEIKFLRPKRRNVNATVNGNNKVQNFQVSVGVDQIDPHINYKHHVVSELNPMIQEEIRIIQNKGLQNFGISQNFSTQISSLTPEARVPISTTRTTLHERFSRI